MKFVTVMDMWLLLLNGVLLGTILYYGRKLLGLVAKATNKVNISSADEERKRISIIIRSELTIYQQAATMGDRESEHIAQVLNELLHQINKDKK